MIGVWEDMYDWSVGICMIGVCEDTYDRSVGGHV